MSDDGRPIVATAGTASRLGRATSPGEPRRDPGHSEGQPHANPLLDRGGKYQVRACRPDTTDLANRFGSALATRMARTELRPTSELMRSGDPLDAAVALARMWEVQQRGRSWRAPWTA